MKKARKLTVSFVNPNPPKAFEAQLKRILLDKLHAGPAFPVQSTPDKDRLVP